jgi:hypothetical protein
MTIATGELSITLVLLSKENGLLFQTSPVPTLKLNPGLNLGSRNGNSANERPITLDL